MAHEMEHVFTGYLLKDPKTHTPPSVSYGGFGTYAFGESGRYMEGDVFGGFLDMKLELSSDMEVNAVRTYSQTFILSYDQVNAIIKRRESRLPFHRTDCLFFSIIWLVLFDQIIAEHLTYCMGLRVEYFANLRPRGRQLSRSTTGHSAKEG